MGSPALRAFDQQVVERLLGLFGGRQGLVDAVQTGQFFSGGQRREAEESLLEPLRRHQDPRIGAGVGPTGQLLPELGEAGIWAA